MAEIVIATVEIDECTTVDNGVQLELPSTKVENITKLTYKVRIKIDITSTVLHPKTGLVDTRAGTILTIKDYWKFQVKCRIKSLESPKLRMVIKEVIKIRE